MVLKFKAIFNSSALFFKDSLEDYQSQYLNSKLVIMLFEGFFFEWRGVVKLFEIFKLQMMAGLLIILNGMQLG